MNNPPNKRLLSLDILRGITIAGMIMVNNPGSWGYIHATAPDSRKSNFLNDI